MIYFLSQDVCDKLNVRNNPQTFKTYAMTEWRDYIRFKPTMNPKAYAEMVDNGLIAPNTPSAFLFTIIGTLEVLFKSKSLEAKGIKDDFVGVTGYEIYGTLAYESVSKVVGSISPDKRKKFYEDQVYAMNLIKDKIGVVNAEVEEAVTRVRLLANASVSNDLDGVNDPDVAVLCRYFKYVNL